MNKKQFTSRGERWGMKAAHGVKWLIRQLKTLDRRCVEKARSKSWPGWVGHLPVVFLAIGVLFAFVYLSLYILFFLGFLTILIIAASNSGNDTSEYTNYDDAFDSTTDYEDSYGPVYMHGNQGDGWYTDDSGTIKLDD